MDLVFWDPKIIKEPWGQKHKYIKRLYKSTYFVNLSC